ncbi:MAG TPA: HAD hydrolase-like protein [Chitinophagaceae bacterium]|jgi:phosphonatase-like hydrolase|nr:HAD hydrolase-like protein [Chitinophagaceae bacterium]
MPVKLVVFDMAGTTVIDKNFVANAFQNAFKKQGIIISTEEISPLMGYEKKLAIQMMLEKHGVDFDDELIQTIYHDFIEEMIDFYEYSPEVKAAPGAEELFQHLKEHSVTVALNTGFPKSIADAIINRFQWVQKGLVDDYIASDEVEEGRPHSYMIDKLMYRSGIDDPALVAKVGDTAVDIEEGKNAGCSYVIAVTTGAYKSDQLEEFRPTHVVNSLSEIHFLIM